MVEGDREGPDLLTATAYLVGYGTCGGAGLAQSEKGRLLVSAPVTTSRFVGSSPARGSVLSAESARNSASLSLCPSLPRACAQRALPLPQTDL